MDNEWNSFDWEEHYRGDGLHDHQGPIEPHDGDLIAELWQDESGEG